MTGTGNPKGNNARSCFLGKVRSNKDGTTHTSTHVRKQARDRAGWFVIWLVFLLAVSEHSAEQISE